MKKKIKEEENNDVLIFFVMYWVVSIIICTYLLYSDRCDGVYNPTLCYGVKQNGLTIGDILLISIGSPILTAAVALGLICNIFGIIFNIRVI